MGLLDMLGSEEGLLGLSLLAAGAPRPGPRNTGAGLLGAFQNVQQFRNAQDEKRAREEERAMRRQQFDMQAQQQAMALQQMQEQAARQKQVDAWRQSIPSPQIGAAQQALSAGGGPTQANAAAMPPVDPRLALLHGGMKAGAIPIGDYLAATGPKAGPKLKNVETMRGLDGRMINVALFEDGSHKVLPYGVRPDIALQSLGNRVMAIDKNDTQGGASFAMGQSPDSVASNALGWANYGLAKQRAAQEGAGQLVETPEGYVRVGRDNQAAPIMMGGRPVVGKGSAPKDMTDAQAKALLFGERMKASDAVIGQMAARGTTMPGLVKMAGEGNESILGGPLRLAGNALQSEDEQQIDQAKRDFINATLRRESGAVISKSEFANANEQYFPQPFDTAPVLKQKAANRRLATELMLREVPAHHRGAAGGQPSLDDLLKKYGN